MPPKATTGKKQQSISSFFSKKPPANDKNQLPPEPSQKPTSTTRQSSTAHLNIRDEESDDVLPATRRIVSNKRPLEEDADAANSGKENPVKRTKGNDKDVDDDEGMFFPEASPKRVEDGSKAPGKGKKAAVTSRTERYVYNPSQTTQDSSTIDEDDEEVRAQKELLHRRFVKKLSHPDSIARLQRRNWQITEETEKLDNEDIDEMDDEEETPAPKAKKKGAKTGKLTPGELQMLEIKRKHLDAILIIEMGYKFKFFGEDARVAAKELGIVCIPGKFRYDEHPSEAHLDRFASASFPVHRLQVHAKRLVLAGHKVGIVRQTETAALKKAGDNRNTPFVRKLTNLYTKGTYVDDIEGIDSMPDATSAGASSSGYLLCITETKAKGWGTDEKVDVGILAVQPATGDIIYDEFEDGFMRSEIETRLLHISPCELLIVGDLTKASEKLVQHLSGSKSNVFGDSVRVERVERPKTMATEAHSHVTQFYAGKMEARGNAGNERASELLEKVLKLAEPITICLSAMITHMTEYGLEHVFDLTKYFQSFSARSHMLIDGNTLESLEIFRNQTDHTEKGSLFWAVNKTRTKFGERLLRKWVSRPLLDMERLQERLDAVEELKDTDQSSNLDKLKALLTKIKSDLERSLLRIYYGKCTRPELLIVLQTLQRISNEFAHIQSSSDAGFESPLINSAIASLPSIGDIIISYLDKINPEAARSDDKYTFFRSEAESEDISNYNLAISSCEEDLAAHLPEAAAKIKKKSVTYVTSSAIEYLIEVPNTDLKNVPASWTKISGTKKLSRFHTPEVLKMTRQLAQYKESLASACDIAFKSLLSEISANYQPIRDTISSLATLDCLLSLATTASQPGYSKPTLVTPTPDCPSVLEITEARHPMIEHLLPPTSPYIPNSTNLSSATTRALLITGPNMGGKSSYVRTTALLILLSQLGSYVPATSLHLTPFTTILTRLGATDNLFTGSSTFHHELSSTSSILKSAASSPRSLIILDELGRGTSTHDGVAIAEAVAEYVVGEVGKGCLMLFITHYQSLARLESVFPGGEIKNVHMKFSSEKLSSARITDADVDVSAMVGNGNAGGSDDHEGDSGKEEITFLYEVGEGVAHRSYGLNVARLAKIPFKVLEVAGRKSRELEEEIRQKKMRALVNSLHGILLLPRVEGRLTSDDDNLSQHLDRLINGIEQL